VSELFDEPTPFEWTRRGDRFRILHPTSKVLVQVDDVERSRDGIHALWTWYDAIDAREPRDLLITRTNLYAHRTLDQLAESLSKANGQLTGNWNDVVHGVARLLLREYRRGTPSIKLLAKEPDMTTPIWMYYPYVQSDGVSILFGEGGTSKSYLMTWIGLRLALGIGDRSGEPLRAPIPVLFLDWEAEEERQRKRWWAVMRGLGADTLPVEEREAIPFHWRRVTGSLGDNMRWVEDEIDRFKIGLLMIDSLGMASAPLGAIEDSNTTNRHHAWVQELGVPALESHHKRKSTGMEGPERHNMFGSVYIFNVARTITELSTTEDVRHDTGGVKKVAARNVKLSDGRVPESVALTWEFLDFPNGSTKTATVTQGALIDEVDLVEKLTVMQRIVKALEHGALKPEAIAEATGDLLSTVRKTCSIGVTQNKLRSIPIPGSKTNERMYGLPVEAKDAPAWVTQ
jgi:hypothetical protein